MLTRLQDGSPHALEIIAEIGVNHDGDVDRARALIDSCAELGVSYAKFQAFRTSALVTEEAPKAAYQTRALNSGSQADMLRKLELSEDDFRAVAAHCEARGVDFLATPFDRASAAFLIDELGCSVVKVGSGDLDNLPLLTEMASRGVRLIVSTGMGTLAEVELAVGAVAYGALMHVRGERYEPAAFPDRDALLSARALLPFDLSDRLTILHCTSEYPAVHESLNLAAIQRLAAAFDLPVGFSDHSEDHLAAIMAYTLGARTFERHLTYDRTAHGPDHAASLDVEGFAEMIRLLNTAQVAMGTGLKLPSEGERHIRDVARKRIVAARPIAAGETLTIENIAFKRAPSGHFAGELYSLLGRAASSDVAESQPIVLS